MHQDLKFWNRKMKTFSQMMKQTGRYTLKDKAGDVLDFMFLAEKKIDPANGYSHTHTRHPAATNTQKSVKLVLIHI